MNSLRIFISYSESDAPDVALAIQKHYKVLGHTVFVSSSSISPGEEWERETEDYISSCDIFLVIITTGSLHSQYVAKEVELAKEHKKLIIPCRYTGIAWDDLRWGLDQIQGFEFYKPSSLLRELDEKLVQIIKKENTKGTKMISEEERVKDQDTATKKVTKQRLISHDARITKIKEKRYVDPKSSLVFVTKWGSEGSGDGEFRNPHSIAIDSIGYVYVVDWINHRIQKFTKFGTFLSKWGSFGFVTEWSTRGTRPTHDDNLAYPSDIAIDSSDHVYVIDSDFDSIKKFTRYGEFVTKWGPNGSGDGEFHGSNGIAINSSGYVYVADRDNYRVQKFTEDGTFVTKWGSHGSGDGQFRSPNGIAINSYGYVYVVDSGNACVQKFTEDGTFVTKWGSHGSGDGNLRYPTYIAIDSSGYVYVADRDNYRVQKFTEDGTFVTKWGSHGSGDGQFRSPNGIAINSYGYVYVVDSFNNCIQVFRSTDDKINT